MVDGWCSRRLRLSSWPNRCRSSRQTSRHTWPRAIKINEIPGALSACRLSESQNLAAYEIAAVKRYEAEELRFRLSVAEGLDCLNLIFLCHVSFPPSERSDGGQVPVRLRSSTMCGDSKASAAVIELRFSA